MSKSDVDIIAHWGGGASPFGISWRKMMMWWFIVSDALLFAGFLASYGFNRLASDVWPDRTQVFHMNFIVAMTFILISSSATMATAVAAASKRDRKVILRFLLLTLLGGICFLGMQAFEWTALIRQGARLDSNPWGAPAFSAFFFMITGFHGTHVLIGVIILAVVFNMARKEKCTAEGVELAGLYWHFVDLVWVFIFGSFYLL
ncbi:MAG: cytochrome c oxidase subunit 3 [Planctomycetes bacterium]|nr:cytochrome c oxidase subunit 3 [Planctomycetota bacterium]